MNKFEAILLLSPEISNTVLTENLKIFEENINKNNGKIVNTEDWGLRDLSYDINNFKKAFYKYFQIEIDGNTIEGLKKNINQDINILNININTLILVLLASVSIVIISLFINYGSRISKSKILNYLTNFSISGYAIPGVILAVAFITFFSNLSDLVSDNLNFKSTKGIFLSFSIGHAFI